MIYEVRWRPLHDDQQHHSQHLLTTAEATDFACALLDDSAVADVWIVDSGGQTVIRMPEIARRHRARLQR